MNTIMFALISFLLVGLSIEQCNPGCLRCSNTNTCLACDTTRNTFLRQNTCYTATATFCQTLAQNNTCLQCNPGYFLDQGTQTCSAVTSPIVNCAVYGSPTTCRTCVDGAIMIAGQCRLNPRPIPNCKQYNPDGSCFKCTPGNVVANNQTACVPLNITNCQAGSFIRCRTCLDGYVYNNNTYLFNLFQFDLAAQAANNLIGFRGGPWAPQSFCQSTYSGTCLDPLSNDCFPSSRPRPPSNDPNYKPNCIAYGASYACTQCAQGFKFASATSCGPVQQVNNCTAYANDNAVGGCLSCVNGMFVQGNQCVARTNNNIPGCVAYSNTTDACATCSPGLIISTDGFRCFQPLPFCAEYLPLTAYYPQNNCALCVRGFFINATFNGTNCTNGTVANCSIYNTYDNSCTVCMPGTYLSNGVCTPHKPIQFCKEYVLQTGIKCKTCEGNRVPFNIINKCIPMNPRPNCVDYSPDGTVCTACNGTNYISTAAATLGQCLPIPSGNPNCVSWNANSMVCNGCAPGFQLNMTTNTPTCSQPYDYVVGNNSRCSDVEAPAPNAAAPSWTDDTNTQTKCSACNSTAFAFTPAYNEAICVRNEQLWYTPNFVNVTNCVRYGKSLGVGNPVVCQECARGFFLSGYQAAGPYTVYTSTTTNGVTTNVATTCVATCASPANAVILDDLMGFVNICVPIVATGLVRLSASCSKYVRMKAANLLTTDTFSDDFVCLNATANAATAAYPTNFLLYDMVASLAAGTVYEKVMLWAPSGSATLPTTWDFSAGFSNTIDTSMFYPSVFNYRGLLTANGYGGNAFIRLALSTEIISATNTKLNTFGNCDIVTNTDLVKVGNAFNGIATLYSPATIGTSYYHCFRCAFGFGLTYSLGTTVALTSPFPSCAALTGCTASLVYGGLPRILNSLLSCHVCTGSGSSANFPTIALEVDGVTGSGLVVGFQPDQAITGTAAARVVGARSGFKCATAPTSVVTGNTANTNAGVNNCTVYGNIRSLNAWATATAAATVFTSVYNPADVNVCLACAARFVPTYLDTNPTTEAATFNSRGLPAWVVSSCEPSQFCDPSATGMFNGCPRCDPNKAPLSGGGVAYNDYSLAHCVYTPTPNCLIAEGILDATNIYPCTACRSGFYLSPSGQCEQLTIPNQAGGPSFFPNSILRKFTAATIAAPSNSLIAMKDIRVAYLQSINSTNYGAVNCTTGYTRMPISDLVQAVCTISSFLNSTRMRFTSNPYYIPNCAKYRAQTALVAAAADRVPKCFECLAPFVATQDGSRCVLFPIPNLCRYAQNPPYTAPNMNGFPSPAPNSTPLCAVCKDGAIYVSGICLNPTIPNCLTYLQTTTTGTLPIRCSVCNDTFAPNADGSACNFGPVERCKTYSDGLTCTACLPGTILINLKNRPYCLPTPGSMNCTMVDTTQSNTFNLVCTRCNNTQFTAYTISPFSPPSTFNGDPADTCLPFNNITNCLIYAPAGRDNANVVGFGCQVCAPGFFWDSTNLYCRTRSVLPLACVEFSLAADTCSGCAPSYYLAADGLTCTPNPSGIANCFSLGSNGLCVVCNTNYYMNGGSCLPVVNQIPNCLYYFADGVCSKCGLGQVAVNRGSLCAFPVTTNCTAWDTPVSCTACPPGLFLTNVTTAAVPASTTSPGIPASTTGVCVNITVGNCSLAGATKESCRMCMPGFFLNSGKCEPVRVNIPGCANYTNATNCQACMPGFVLTFDGNGCVPGNYNNLADPNCADSIVDSRPLCTACNPGYYFDRNGSCVQCGQIPTGCAYCNPFAPDICLFCATGYTMDATFNCVVQATIPNNPPPAA